MQNLSTTPLTEAQAAAFLNPKEEMAARPRYNERMPRIGEIVLFYPNPNDDVARSNQNDGPIAAIVTRPWSSITVNLKIIPDHGPMQDRGSVSHYSANAAGYHWRFMDEVYPAPVELQNIVFGDTAMVGDTPRRSRMDLWCPAEKAIYNAMQEVEKMPASVLLTEAVKMLQVARNKVADYVDTTPPSHPGDNPTVKRHFEIMDELYAKEKSGQPPVEFDLSQSNEEKR